MIEGVCEICGLPAESGCEECLCSECMRSVPVQGQGFLYGQAWSDLVSRNALAFEVAFDVASLGGRKRVDPAVVGWICRHLSPFMDAEAYLRSRSRKEAT